MTTTIEPLTSYKVNLVKSALASFDINVNRSLLIEAIKAVDRAVAKGVKYDWFSTNRCPAGLHFGSSHWAYGPRKEEYRTLSSFFGYILSEDNGPGLCENWPLARARAIQIANLTEEELS